MRMYWVRGHTTDWDSFAAEAGDMAWNYESVKRIYRRIEDWSGSRIPSTAEREGLFLSRLRTSSLSARPCARERARWGFQPSKTERPYDGRRRRLLCGRVSNPGWDGASQFSLVWSKHSAPDRSDQPFRPKPFCQGEAGAVGLSTAGRRSGASISIAKCDLNPARC